MSYQQRAKYKNLKRYLYKVQESLRFKTGHITHAGKIVLFWSVIIILSLFFTWVDSGSLIHSGGAFARVSGKPATMILIIIGFIYFSLFSIEKKEKMKLISNFYFKDYTSCILWGIFIIMLCISSFNYISWLQMFESDISSGKWPILCLCGAIIMTVGGFVMKMERSKNITGTFVHEPGIKNTAPSQEEKNNMKLPF